MRETIPVVGIWDDHDFGLDNSGKHYRNKQVQKQMYLNFTQEPMNSERRSDVIEGTYWDYYVTSDDIKVHLLLLDTRYNLEPEVDTLGERQWEWLETKLFQKSHDSDLVLLASGIQFLNFDNFFLSEAWDPESRARLLRMLIKHGIAHKTIFLSGDVHYS